MRPASTSHPPRCSPSACRSPRPGTPRKRRRTSRRRRPRQPGGSAGATQPAARPRGPRPPAPVRPSLRPSPRSRWSPPSCPPGSGRSSRCRRCATSSLRTMRTRSWWCWRTARPSLAGRLPDDPRIRYIATGAAGAQHRGHAQRGVPAGPRRHRGPLGRRRLVRTRAAHPPGGGHPGRVEADITALRDSLMLDLAAWRFWRCRPDLHRRLFVRDVHGGTLVYRRRVWQEKAQFPDRSLAEDAVFLDQAVRRGARLRAVEADGHLRLRPARHQCLEHRLRRHRGRRRLGGRSPSPTSRPMRGRSTPPARRPPRSEAPPRWSAASCPRSTAARFVPQAVRYFLRQDYPAKELIIVDDGPEPVSDLLPADDRIVYHRLEYPDGPRRQAQPGLRAGPRADHRALGRRRLGLPGPGKRAGSRPHRAATPTSAERPACCTTTRPARARGGSPGPAGSARGPPGPACASPRSCGPAPRSRKWRSARIPASSSAPPCAASPTSARPPASSGSSTTGTPPPSPSAARTGAPGPSREVEDLLGDDMAFYRHLAEAASGEGAPDLPETQTRTESRRLSGGGRSGPPC